MKEARAFQTATTRAALAAFSQEGGRRRYLVADEVGLGKTVVARDVVSALAAKKTGQLVVYYIANGTTVANQNKPRVVEFLPDELRKLAVQTPDRLSLITVSTPPKTSVAVYALTPETSFPGLKKSNLTGGRAVERALIGALLANCFPSVLKRLPAAFLRLGAKSGWRPAQHLARKRLASLPPGLIARYRDAIHREFGDLKSESSAPSFAGRLVDHAKIHPRRFIGRLRRALCLACLIHQPPDIVILDEFQRYRELLNADAVNNPLMSHLLKGRDGRLPALLLLSATPYRLIASRWDESRGIQAHRELFDLVEFLAGPDCRTEAETLFKDFGETLRELVGSPSETRGKHVDEAKRLRDRLQALLLPVIGRTERDVFNRASGDLEPHYLPLSAISSVQDVIAYRHLARSSEPKRQSDAIAYWSSVPLPAQALGQRYAISRGQVFTAMKGLTALTRARREKFVRTDWPDAKLRALEAAAPAADLALPWVAPSLPWWDLGGSWADRSQDTKLLMFSRFKATPPAVASLMSFGVEARFIDRGGGYEKAFARRKLKLSDRPGPVMGAFHPSIWLIRNTDPLKSQSRTRAGVRSHVRKQLISALRKLDIELNDSTLEKRRRHRSIGRVIAAIEQTAGLAGRSADAWAKVVGHDLQALAAVAAWRQTPRLDFISPLELEDLVNYALGAPGVVVGRALLRHASDALDSTAYDAVLRLSWQGLRAYLDNPVLLPSMGGTSAVDAVTRATFEGNLESVLDEHLWTRGLSHEGAETLAGDLYAALKLTTGGFNFQSLGRGGKLRLRCHAAMPFGEAEAAPAPKSGAPAQNLEDATGPARPDEIRRSFNSPFWPHVLATTSVGQEGLDFHTWCARVLHWDLPSNPLDMEQREGRIQRYAGLAIRRRLGDLLRSRILDQRDEHRVSPWSRLAAVADTEFSSADGLSPWWILPQAQVKRHVFERPFGRDTVRYRMLREQRFIYRLALGQPNQQDLLEVLAKSDAELKNVLEGLTLELCPFSQIKAA